MSRFLATATLFAITLSLTGFLAVVSPFGVSAQGVPVGVDSSEMLERKLELQRSEQRHLRGLADQIAQINDQLRQYPADLAALGQPYVATLLRDRRQRILAILASKSDSRAALISQVKLDEGSRRDLEELNVQYAQYLEREFTLQGTLEIQIGDGFDKSETYVKLEHDGHLLEIVADASLLAQPGFTTGSKVSLALLAVPYTDGSDVLVIEDASILEAAAPIPTSIHKVLVIPVTFSDNATMPYTRSDLESMMFSAPTSANNFWRSTSYDQAGLAGTVTEWLPIPYQGGGRCDRDNWYNSASSAAASAGYNLANYHKRMIVWSATKTGDPNWGSCDKAGYGTLAGARTWVQLYDWAGALYNTATMAHEIGHNFGFHHAGGLYCPDKTYDTQGCEFREYGDPFSNMGQYYFELHSPHKYHMGWLPADRGIEVTTDGLFDLTPGEFYEGLKVIKIRIPGGPTNFYYISYRVPSGAFDVDFSRPDMGPNIGAHIHMWNGNPQIVSTMLVAWPNHSFTLLDGMSFYDPANRIRVTQISHDNTKVTVSVSFNSDPPPPVPLPTSTITSPSPSPVATPSPQPPNSGACHLVKPLVTVDGSRTGAPAVERSFDVTVRSRNFGACGPTTFAITHKGIKGWETSLSDAFVELDSGQQTTIQLRVIPKPLAKDKTYKIAVAAVSSKYRKFKHKTHALYEVVKDDFAPATGAIVKPIDGQSISDLVIPFSVDVQDDRGVFKVELYAGQSRRVTSTEAPFVMNLAVRKTQTVEYRLKLTDVSGNISWSPAITLTTIKP